MKDNLASAALAFLVCVVLCGCRSDSNPGAPGTTGYVTPAQLVGRIHSADHIVVQSLAPSQPALPGFTRFSATIRGPEVRRIIYAIASVRHPAYTGLAVRSSMLYEWQLQFYRGQELLGTAELGCDMIQCDGDEYHSPWTLRRLYHHIAKASGEDN
jgi:hypothetical protein